MVQRVTAVARVPSLAQELPHALEAPKTRELALFSIKSMHLKPFLSPFLEDRPVVS